jgi:hypothetical protein
LIYPLEIVIFYVNLPKGSSIILLLLLPKELALRRGLAFAPLAAANTAFRCAKRQGAAQRLGWCDMGKIHGKIVGKSWEIWILMG